MDNSIFQLNNYGWGVGRGVGGWGRGVGTRWAPGPPDGRGVGEEAADDAKRAHLKRKINIIYTGR